MVLSNEDTEQYFKTSKPYTTKLMDTLSNSGKSNRVKNSPFTDINLNGSEPVYFTFKT